MPKKKVPKKTPSAQLKWRDKRGGVIAVALIMGLSLAVAILAQWRNRHTSTNFLSPASQASPTPQLSKEYIYAGGRFIATEQPSGSSPLTPPSSLIATGTSTPQVNLTWTAATGGTVDHYQIERTQNIASGYTIIAPNVAATSYNDTGVSPGSAYLYRVRAVDTQGDFTNYSNIDLATTITFEDDPLISYAENPTNATPIRAVHLNQLRQAVNAVRALTGLSSASWTYPDPVSSPASQQRKIYLEDIAELRTKLDEALTILGMSQSYPTNPPLARGSAITAAHFMQIRARVK